MKQIVTILLLVGCTLSTGAGNSPSELKNLQAIRAKKIKEIDRAYVKALEKLKVKYTKGGNLEYANAVNSALLEMENNKQASVVPGTNSAKSLSHSSTEIQLPEGTKTKEVDGGIIAYIKPAERIKWFQVEKAAQQYGEFFCPRNREDGRAILKLVPNGEQCWLNISCELENDEVILSEADGTEFDHKQSRIDAPAKGDGRYHLNQGKPCKVLINKQGELGFMWQQVAVNGYIVFIPNE